MKLLIQAGVCANLLLAAPASFVHVQSEKLVDLLPHDAMGVLEKA
jgi:hypothetical protein